ncbi:reverse transcriptase domain-containing protein [Tanacetum coccineum]
MTNAIPDLEKRILALVHGARRLPRYFQAHLIIVLTDKPIKQILSKPKKSGRVAKWAIELGDHKIKLKGRNSIKGQILTYLLAETPSVTNKEEDEETKKEKQTPSKAKKTWKLYTDEASSSDGSGSGLMLISTEGKEYTYALRFKFEATNNEA